MVEVVASLAQVEEVLVSLCDVFHTNELEEERKQTKEEIIELE